MFCAWLQAAESAAPPRAAVAVYHNTTSAQATSHGSGSGGGGSAVAAEVEMAVTAHLMAGAREEALACAVQGKAWALALVIASVCSADRYKEVPA